MTGLDTCQDGSRGHETNRGAGSASARGARPHMELEMVVDLILGGAVAIGLFAYLFYTLLRPEKF